MTKQSCRNTDIEALHRIRRMVDKYPTGHDLLTPATWMLEYIVRNTHIGNLDKDELLAKLTEADQYQFRRLRPVITAKETRELLYGVIGQLESAAGAGVIVKPLDKGQTTLW